jgi:hypothetical protein
MTTEARAFAAELAGYFRSPEAQAWTVHRPGQMTVSDYRRLDKVEPCEITGIARVRARAWPDGLALEWHKPYRTAGCLPESHPDDLEHQPLWVDLQVCPKCGAVVHDGRLHNAWDNNVSA